MRYTKPLNIITCLFLFITGCDNSTIVTDPATFNSYQILNNTNSKLLSKIVTFNYVEADSVFELPAGQRTKLFDYIRFGEDSATPKEALKRIGIFQDSAGVLKQVYLQDPINSSLWESESDKNDYRYTLVIDENDIR